MDRLSVYLVESKIFGDPTPNKARPAVFFHYQEGKIWLLGVYSERKKFHFYPAQYYQIQDKSAVPLTGKAKSFVWVAKIIRLQIQEFQKVTCKKMKALSQKDTVGLINHFNNYHSK